MPKNPSLKKVAKTYRKTHSKPKVEWSGARIHTGDAGVRGVATVESKLTYKPKAKAATFGGTRGGKGATIYKKKAK